VARRVAMLLEGTFASPAYIERYGEPRTLEELDKHRMVGFVSSVTGNVIPLEFIVGGRTLHKTPRVAVSVTAAETMVTAARLGLGLIQVPIYHLAADLAAGRLVEVLRDFRPTATPASVLYPQSRQLSLRVRVFIDWLIQEFAAISDGLTKSPGAILDA
jgi:DNA-binding transcriptional LysR family regulator